MDLTGELAPSWIKGDLLLREGREKGWEAFPKTKIYHYTTVNHKN